MNTKNTNHDARQRVFTSLLDVVEDGSAAQHMIRQESGLYIDLVESVYPTWSKED